jgi:hypothetical protein
VGPRTDSVWSCKKWSKDRHRGEEGKLMQRIKQEDDLRFLSVLLKNPCLEQISQNLCFGGFMFNIRGPLFMNSKW